MESVCPKPYANTFHDFKLRLSGPACKRCLCVHPSKVKVTKVKGWVKRARLILKAPLERDSLPQGILECRQTHAKQMEEGQGVMDHLVLLQQQQQQQHQEL